MLAKSVGQFKLTGLVYLDSGTKKSVDATSKMIADLFSSILSNSRWLPIAEMSDTLNKTLTRDEQAHYPFGCRVETGSVIEKRRIPKRRKKKRGRKKQKPKFVIVTKSVPVFRAYCLAITKNFMELFAQFVDSVNGDLKEITDAVQKIKSKME
ncbi:unnamed protein product [Cylicostephanus goldi]|uniref:Uncharacterized protein n=1 Tax=Cylicostephanus goldi TaxID=71465 RepID=A0A3P6SF16_CYLGO|nr:unnamed protein product [Cylicostephanus goldi]